MENNNEISRIIIKALKDPEFKKRLMKNPRATLEKELNIQIPQEIDLQILEETGHKKYLILPNVDLNEVNDTELNTLAAGAAGTFFCTKSCTKTLKCWEANHPKS